MGQQVIFSSKLKERKTVGVVKANLNKMILVTRFRPETKWSNHEQVEIRFLNLEGPNSCM